MTSIPDIPPVQGRPIPMHQVCGLNLPSYFHPDQVMEAVHLTVKPGDVFVMTYPKCGTTWMRYIVWSIQNKGSLPLPSMKELDEVAPFLERHGCSAYDEQKTGVRAGTSHFPYDLMPIHPLGRYIYVARNPKDAAVSYYGMCKSILGGDSYKDASFSEFFEEFIESRVPYGDFFDHILGWWNHRNDDNVLFTTYEEMKADPAGVILKVAQFISDDTNDYINWLQSDAEALNRIVANTSFDSMKTGVKVVLGGGAVKQKDISENFFRKGIVGDWVHFFNADQQDRIETRTRLKFAGTGIERLWDENGH